MAPQPLITARYVWIGLNVEGSSYYFGNQDNSGAIISDTSSNSSDDLGILGDQPDDYFSVTISGVTQVHKYIGQPSDRAGIMSEFGGSTYLFANQDVGRVTSANLVVKPFDLSEGLGPVGEPAPCYVTGTRIRTAVGDVAVESLRVGDFAVTSSGAMRPIRWIGHRTVACRRHPHPSLVLPVRITADAFGPSRPARSLVVSPAHAICIKADGGEVLIPAIRLINGTTITQAEVEEVTYWHVELDSHDILLAEGLPAESYLDCGNRSFFANADVTSLAAVPDARPTGPLPFCRPFHEAGPLVELVRTHLAERAVALGWRKVEETFAGLHLVADGAVIRPDVADLVARFVLPAEARDVRLVSAVSVPAHVMPSSGDERRLGVPVGGLAIDDGLTGARAIALDDPRLGEGFHAAEAGARWTNGSAALPAEMWAGCNGSFVLRVTLAGPALPRWVVAPSETASARALRCG